MPADFPQSPAINDTFVATNGATYTWDGVKWVNTGCPSGGGLDNLLAGTCITLPKTGDLVTVNASIPCIQTPWLQNVNAGGFQLTNASSVQTPAVSSAPGNALTLTGANGINLGSNVDAANNYLLSNIQAIGIGKAPFTPYSLLDMTTANSNTQGINYTNTSPLAKNPAIQFSNDAAVGGILLPGSAYPPLASYRSNVVVWSQNNFIISTSTDSNERMRVTSAGNVGIHTATPQTMLDVQGVAPSGQIQFGNGTGRAALYCDTLNGGIGTISNIPLIFWTDNGSPQMTLTTAGNVGIGTPTPQTLLHVNKAASGAVGPIIRLDNTNGALHDAASVQFWDSNLRGELKFSIDTSPYGTDFIFLSGAAGTTEVMRVTSAGNVGIGTASPAVLLNIDAGTIPGAAGSSLTAARYQFANPNADQLNFYGIVVTAGVGWSGMEWRIQRQVDTVPMAAIGVSSHLAFYTGSSGSPQQRMYIDDNGNVGIGQSNPRTQLDVTGVISCSYLNGQSGTDFSTCLGVSTGMGFPPNQPVTTLTFNFNESTNTLFMWYRRTDGVTRSATIAFPS